jgi:hypothetical protein
MAMISADQQAQLKELADSLSVWSSWFLLFTPLDST